jgi:hypothetical protein
VNPPWRRPGPIYPLFVWQGISALLALALLALLLAHK